VQGLALAEIRFRSNVHSDKCSRSDYFSTSLSTSSP